MMMRWDATVVSSVYHTCYNKMQHTTISWACQRCGVPEKAMITTLTPIQNIGFYSMKGFGKTEMPSQVS